MKKLMLSAAVAAIAIAAAPAMAQDESGVKLNLGGHFSGYVNYTNEDGNVRSTDILRDTVVTFGGETTLDNGLTVGAQLEADADAGDGFNLDETYAYFSGTWGRVNFGSEDGAAYLLQVAAPTADENISGLRGDINPFNTATNVFHYNNSVAEDADKLTYLTPVFSGFQAGLSFAPENNAVSRGANGNSLDNTATQLENIYEVAARYEGEFSGVGLTAGAGYTHGTQEVSDPARDDYKEWNVGLDLNVGAFGVGAVYTEDNQAVPGSLDDKKWVVGADYTTGPFKVGASYHDTNTEVTATTETETKAYTLGAQYSYGPGMSFRGSVSHFDTDPAVGADTDGTAVTVGTHINF